MSQRIELAALVVREGRLCVVRTEAGWTLPGGVLPEGHDVDAAMDEVLERFGIHAPAVEEDFLQTVYLQREDETQTILNLYGPTEWTGEPSAPDGGELGWFGLAELPAIEMDAQLQNAVLEVLGLAGPATNEDERILAAINEGLPPAARPHRHAPRFTSRREAGLDVLATLNATDGEKAARRMYRTFGALTDDVLDFTLGDVWANDAIDRRTMSLQVVAMIAALGHAGPLRSHINGALNHGATPEQLVQTMRLVAAYAGFPAALEAWRTLEKVLAGRGIDLNGGQP